jgi:hypothetical protein
VVLAAPSHGSFDGRDRRIKSGRERREEKGIDTSRKEEASSKMSPPTFKMNKKNDVTEAESLRILGQNNPYLALGPPPSEP